MRSTRTIKDLNNLLKNCCIEDRTLLSFIDGWYNTNNPSRKIELEKKIIGIIEERERASFFIRFELKKFDSWNSVLTEEESNVNQAHKAKFYEPFLIKVLKDNGGKLEPIKAIKLVVEHVKDHLTPADYFITGSKRFRYDTTIRFLANNLKARGLLMKKHKDKNKLWVLSDRATRNENKGLF